MSALQLMDNLIRQVEAEMSMSSPSQAQQAQQQPQPQSQSTNNEITNDLSDQARDKAILHEKWCIDPNKKASEFRNYDKNPRQAKVEEFYKNQHRNQTYEFVLSQREKHLKFNKCKMTVWDMIHYLNNVIDDSDPDTDLTQLDHALQTAEAARKEYPSEEYDWLHVTAFIHDLGKILAVTDEKLGLIGDPQWCVVGDNFPVGCQFSKKNIYYEYFQLNKDYNNEKYNSKYGIYNENICNKYGLMNDENGNDNILMSWGHDEYLYQICKKQSKLPIESLYMLRFHSFYPWHCKGDYMYLCNKYDIEFGLKWVKEFNKFDLYSKSTECPPFDQVKDYYKMKIEKYFPNPVQW